jgi:hypothetical protein
VPGIIAASLPGMANLTELTAEVLEPGDPRYDEARMPAMARFRHLRPLAVVRCASTEDVVATLGYARSNGVPVVPRGGGHCFAGRSSTEGIVLDLSPMRTISLSHDGTVTIGAGARLAEVYDALHEHGLTLPAGCGPTVGIAGLTLGGGLGLLGRRYGLTCDRLLGAEVVLADGRIVHCDAEHEPDLFWALRGAGGGQFGVVTSLIFDPVPEPATTRLELTWPLATAPALIAAWQEWAPDAPDTFTANLAVTPAGVRMFGAMLGSEAETTALLGDLPGPTSQSLASYHYRDLKRSLAGPNADFPIYSKSAFFSRSLPTETITALLEDGAESPVRTRTRHSATRQPAGTGVGRALGRTSGPPSAPLSPHQTWELNFTALGGAYNRVPEDATAYVHRGERFLLEHMSSPEPEWSQRSWTIANPFSSGRGYPNFPDPDIANWAEVYHGDNYPRLARIKRQYDPDGVFRFSP